MGIHSTAIVHEESSLGAGVDIGPYSIVEEKTNIGSDTQIAARCSIKQFTTLGRSNRIFEGAVLGGEPQDVGFNQSVSYLRIGDYNQIREGVTMHRGTQPESETVVDSHCFIMAGAHVAHNCRLGERVILANNVALAGYVEIGDRAFLSGGVVVHQFCKIGTLAMIGGNSKIVQDCLPCVITDGMPGRACGLNVVGLRRAGYASADIQQLKQAYRLVLRSGLPVEAALDRLAELDSPLVATLADFIRGSRRGFCRT